MVQHYLLFVATFGYGKFSPLDHFLNRLTLSAPKHFASVGLGTREVCRSGNETTIECARVE